MTRKEAIRLLSGLMFKGKLKEALKMAISSLETDEAYQLEYERTTKNNLGVDAVSRQEVLYLIADYDLSMGQVVKGIHALPSVTPQEPILDKIREEIKVMISNRGILSCSISYINKEIDKVFDKYKAESEDKE